MKKYNSNQKNYICSDYNNDNFYLQLSDGTRIRFVHDQQCCESVYADLSALEDTGFETDGSLTLNNIHITFVKDYGIKLNEYGIPCYNEQNGFYSSDISIIIEYSFDASDYGHNVY